MFGGSSKLPTTAEHCFIVWTVLNDLITARSAVVGSWEEPPNIRLTVAKNAFVGRALNYRVRMLLKGAVLMSFVCRGHFPCFVVSSAFASRFMGKSIFTVFHIYDLFHLLTFS